MTMPSVNTSASCWRASNLGEENRQHFRICPRTPCAIQVLPADPGTDRQIPTAGAVPPAEAKRDASAH